VEVLRADSVIFDTMILLATHAGKMPMSSKKKKEDITAAFFIGLK
jgi:hypothetical protein